MTSAARVALFAAVALLVAGLATDALVRRGSMHFMLLATAVADFAVMAVLVWVGTFVGARRSAPASRTSRLAQAAAFLWGFLGVVLAFPIKTHAVVVDLPRGGADGGRALLPMTLSAVIVFVAGAAVIILVAFILVRALAALLPPRKP